MKKWLNIGFSLCVISFMLISCTASRKIAEAEQPAVGQMVKDQDFIFKADRLTAQNGFTKILTTDYWLKVSKDTIDARLPYYGRAYTAPSDLTGGGIQFVSTEFGYDIHQGKKQMWEIDISPKDQSYDYRVDDMKLSITPSGYATLIVTSTRRQRITFYGKIKERN